MTCIRNMTLVERSKNKKNLLISKILTKMMMTIWQKAVTQSPFVFKMNRVAMSKAVSMNFKLKMKTAKMAHDKKRKGYRINIRVAIIEKVHLLTCKIALLISIRFYKLFMDSD